MPENAQCQYPRRGMKAKTIKAIIAKKVSAWIDSITDQELKVRVKANTIVTGGAIASMLLGEKVNDFDLYFRDAETVEKVANYYVSLFRAKHGAGKEISVVKTDDQRVMIVVKSSGVAGEQPEKPGHTSAVIATTIEDPGAIEDVYEETEQASLEAEDKGKGPKYQPIFLSTNAITLTNKVQLILRFYGDPDEIHKNYDYMHCTNYWTSEGELVLRPQAMESLLSRELRYVGSKYPICSVIRLRKFLARGWVVNAGQIVKMAYQISKLDLDDLEVLRDQLTGVDVAYFMQVVDALEKKDTAKVDGAYLIELIDKMF